MNKSIWCSSCRRSTHHKDAEVDGLLRWRCNKCSSMKVWQRGKSVVIQDVVAELKLTGVVFDQLKAQGVRVIGDVGC